MDIPSVLDRLGLASQDWGPGGVSGATYEQLVAGWRGSVAVPSEAEMNAVQASMDGEAAAKEFAKVSKQLEIVRSEKKPSLTFTRQSVSLAGVGGVEKVVVEGATKGVAGTFAVSSGGTFSGGTFGVGLGASTTIYNASDTLMVGVSRQGKVTVKRSDGASLWDVYFDLMIV